MRLTKRDVELLMSVLDSGHNPELLVDALRTALHKTLDLEARDDDWAALVAGAAERSGWSNDRRSATINGESQALEALAVELNECRELRPPFSPQN